MSAEQMAEKFDMSKSTAHVWCAKPRIKAVIAAIRQEKRLWLSAQNLILERKAYRMLHRILDARITGDNIAVQFKTVEYVMNLLGGGSRNGVSKKMAATMTYEEDVYTPFTIGVDKEMRDVSKDSEESLKNDVIERKNYLASLMKQVARIENE